jgi:hypothetical protein
VTIPQGLSPAGWGGVYIAGTLPALQMLQQHLPARLKERRGVEWSVMGGRGEKELSW